jgi:hypothetical protein
MPGFEPFHAGTAWGAASMGDETVAYILAGFLIVFLIGVVIFSGVDDMKTRRKG